ncbi:hypothetical protein GQ55_4G329400 [Panicum hallii var. hallii]|uniref:FBD domain-containing protein n=1 Tax=Panicum hallii var. hallii TaxID=1504633 RepID=A0A2T7E2L1_9POAL|nr:hypothetical protein GQ55_4G329400 [Panicum hallii var. hallii]
MGSTAAAEEDARVAKRARLAPPAGDADLISGLDDDVLLRVLGLVGDARDAARTGALSRRWLGLWTRAPALRFASQPGGFWRAAPASAASLERYAASVDAALARRARSGCAIERLSIAYAAGSEHYPVEQPSFADAAELWIPCPRDTETERILEQLMPASVRAARGWIGYAFRHGVKSFDLDLQLPLVLPNFLRERDGVEEVELDDELPSAVRLETMRLALGGAQLRLPAAMTFASLTNLSLERIRIAAGGAALLGHLVSSATCPRLQKLRVRWIYLPAFHEEMAIEADVLSELWMEDVRILMSLKLRTPRLRVLHIYKCSHVALRISAPRLEELGIIFRPACPPRWLEIDVDLPCVRSLKICLWSHLSRLSGDREAENDKYMLLLRQCSSLTCLQVFLRGAKASKKDVDMIKSRVPHLPHITSLAVNVSCSFKRHGYGASVASLLTRFSNLRRLSLHLPFFDELFYNLPAGLDLLCHHRYHWKSNEISMAHLQEVELTGLTGTDCEVWFMKTMLASAKGLFKVAISFNPYCWQHQGKMDAFERMLLDEGMWTSHRDTHMLTCLRESIPAYITCEM